MYCTITRGESTDQGTFGKLLIVAQDRSFSCLTLELPWRDNQRCISCIPEGYYDCDYSNSIKFGRPLYKVRDVPNRSGILFHSGNQAGDTAKGLQSDVRGCILLGQERGVLGGQDSVLGSRDTLTAFHGFTQDHSFMLRVMRESNE